MKEIKNCTTCEYRTNSAFGPECGPCKYRDNGTMTGWVPAKEKKTLDEYSIEDLKAEIEKREREEEKKKEEAANKWLETFVIGDYYKITLKDSPKRFVIVRAEHLVKLAADEQYLSCSNVYDHGMGWIRLPSISPHFKTTTRYIVEHIIEGTGLVTM